MGAAVSALHEDQRIVHPAGDATGGSRDVRFDKGLSLLRQGLLYSRELNRDIWDFAVEIGALRRAGLTTNDLRWLVCKNYIEHATEMAVAAEEKRQFRPSGKLHFTRRTCFVLSADGIALLEARNGVGPAAGTISEALKLLQKRPDGWDVISSHDNAERITPQWDCDRREIRLGSHVVKQFKLPSPNQETILMAFEEEGWPPRIDDPLPTQPHLDPKRRLHDTIRSLNRHQKHRLLRFKGDGTGEGVLWEAFDRQLEGCSSDA